MKQKTFSTTLFAVLLLLLVSLLYGPFVGNPSIFDDIYFFSDPKGFLAGLVWHNPWSYLLDIRWLSRWSLSLTHEYWGTNHRAYHVGNLLLHAATAISLFLFLRDLLAHEAGKTVAKNGNSIFPAFVAALLFALHPVAAFAVGYIIERSIVLAGLMSVWMWIAVHRGVSTQQIGWLLLSAGCYFLAVFSKEHAITALLVALLIAWNAAEGRLRKAFSALKWVFPLWIATAILILLRMKGYLGAAYEPLLAEMGETDPHGSEYFLRSVLNQGSLFFKYLLLWCVPNENWMSLDLRPAFPPSLVAWPWLVGGLAFIVYAVLIAFFVWRGKLSRLLGIALLSPWLLFLTMFGAVQYQEPFVLYRSYLWALPGMLLPALALSRIPLRAQILAMIVLGLVSFGCTWSRLQTFSHPLLVWDEAVIRLNGHDSLPGVYRIYYNRGNAHAEMGGPNLILALQDFNKVIALNPNYAQAYNNRGAAYMELSEYAKALADFERAIEIKPDYLRAHRGRGLALLKLDRAVEGLAELAYACQAGVACTQYEEELGIFKKNGGSLIQQGGSGK